MVNSFVVSGISALIGAVAGTAIGYAIVATRHERLRNASVALANVTSNAGGISLAFAYITVLGSTGAITIALKLIGIDLYSFFSLYSMAGLIIVYVYFQVPLMVVLMLPAFAALRKEWSEASMTLGGTPARLLAAGGHPVLLPAIVSGTILMFASGMGAYATAVALISQANLMTVQISILRQGEVIFNPSQADAMATLLLVFVAAAVVLHYLLQRRTQRWAADDREPGRRDAERSWRPLGADRAAAPRPGASSGSGRSSSSSSSISRCRSSGWRCSRQQWHDDDGAADELHRGVLGVGAGTATLHPHVRAVADRLGGDDRGRSRPDGADALRASTSRCRGHGRSSNSCR